MATIYSRFSGPVPNLNNFILFKKGNILNVYLHEISFLKQRFTRGPCRRKSAVAPGTPVRPPPRVPRILHSHNRVPGCGTADSKTGCQGGPDLCTHALQGGGFLWLAQEGHQRVDGHSWLEGREAHAAGTGGLQGSRSGPADSQWEERRLQSYRHKELKSCR